MKFHQVKTYQLPVAILPSGERIYPVNDVLEVPDHLVEKSYFEFSTWDENGYGEMEEGVFAESWEEWRKSKTCSNPRIPGSLNAWKEW